MNYFKLKVFSITIYHCEYDDSGITRNRLPKNVSRRKLFLYYGYLKLLERFSVKHVLILTFSKRFYFQFIEKKCSLTRSKGSKKLD